VGRSRPELLVLILAAMGVVAAAPLNTDTGYCLIAGRRLLEGSRLYVDMIETNPPMIFWLMAALARIGPHLALSDAQLVGGFVAVLLLVSGTTTIWILGMPPRVPRAVQFVAVGAFLGALTLPYVSWTGQREQVAAILFLPYVMLISRVATGVKVATPLAVWCGVLAAVGLAIKPFFLAAWIAVELMLVLSLGRLATANRVEVWVVALLQAVYAALVLTLTPEYITRIYPLARAFYGAYGNPWSHILSSRAFLTLLVISAAAVSQRWLLPDTPHVQQAALFGAAALGWLVAFVAQKKGWAYHLMPAFAFATSALALMIVNAAAALRGYRSGLRRRAVLAAFAVVIVIALTSASRGAVPVLREALALLRDQQPPAVLALADEIESTAPGQPVYFLSTSVWPAFPVINLSGARWPYHYHFLWPIPALYARGDGALSYRSPGAQGALEREFFETVVDDLLRVPPRVLVVDHRSDQQAMRGRTFDFIAYFSASPAFTTLLQQYRRRGYIGSWELYERR
jgi:hypothetical protein